MPLHVLRTYAGAIDKAKSPNIVMVMRGFVNGMDDIDSTLLFASRMLMKDSSCKNIKVPCPTFNANMQIDPLLFKRYQITEVPAVVYASNVKLLNVGGSEGIEENASIGTYYKTSGDAALDYHLDTINKEVHQKSLEKLTEAIRKGFY
jgi:type-F conjugative transfer system pilin assembly protein TrbC